MSFLTEFQKTFKEIFGRLTPGNSGLKRKRGPPDNNDIDQHELELPKRQAVPGSTKKALHFIRPRETSSFQPTCIQGGKRGPIVQQNRREKAEAPASVQRHAVPPGLGASFVSQAAKPQSTYTSPQLLQRRSPFLAYSRAKRTISPLAQVQSDHEARAVGDANRVLAVNRGNQLRQNTPKQGFLDQGQTQWRRARDSFQPPSSTPSRFGHFKPMGNLVSLANRIHTKPGRPSDRTIVDHEGRDLLKKAVRIQQELDQVRQQDVAVVTESIDLTGDDEDRGCHAFENNRADPSLPPEGSGAGFGTADGNLLYTPSLLRTAYRQQPGAQPATQETGERAAERTKAGLADMDGSAPYEDYTVRKIPFTPSLLRAVEDQLHESQVPAAAISLSLLEDDTSREQHDKFRKVLAEAEASAQRAMEVNRTVLKAARGVQTELDRQKALKEADKLEKELRQLEEEMSQRLQRRQAATEILAPIPPVQSLVPLQEEEDVVELLSSDDEQEHHRAHEAYSAAATEEEEELLQDELAELAVSGELAELPVEHYERYEEVLSRTGNPMEQLVMHQRSQIEIRRKEIACMAPLQWLNDEVINLYISLLLERDMRKRALGVLPKCHFFSTFFANKLYKDTGYSYSNVQKWTQPRQLKRQGQESESILDCDRVILPVHQGMHWVCAVIDIANKQFIYYDSLKGEDHKCLDNLSRYLAEEYQSKRNQTVDTSSWERLFPKDIPQQHNGCDCGVFTLLFAEYAGRDAAMLFSQKHINYFRVKIVNDILKQKID